MNATPRIFLVHAVDVSMAPASNSFKKLWPEASIVNLLDESLAIDMLIDGKMTPRMVERFARLGQYCVDAGADAILFTCSAFGEAINHLKTFESIYLCDEEESIEDIVPFVACGKYEELDSDMNYSLSTKVVEGKNEEEKMDY
jgi:hypothetical protein